MPFLLGGTILDACYCFDYQEGESCDSLYYEFALSCFFLAYK